MPVHSRNVGSPPNNVGTRKRTQYTTYPGAGAAESREFPRIDALDYWFDSRFVDNDPSWEAWIDQGPNGVAQTQSGSPVVVTGVFNGLDAVQYSNVGQTSFVGTTAYYDRDTPYTVLVAGRVLNAIGGGFGVYYNIRGATPETTGAFLFQRAGSVWLTILTGLSDAGGNVSNVNSTRIEADIDAEYLNNHWFVIVYNGLGETSAANYKIRVINDPRTPVEQPASGGIFNLSQFPGTASVNPFCYIAMYAKWNIALTDAELDQLGRYMYDYSGLGTPVSLRAPEAPELIDEGNAIDKEIGVDWIDNVFIGLAAAASVAAIAAGLYWLLS